MASGSGAQVRAPGRSGSSSRDEHVERARTSTGGAGPPLFPIGAPASG
ncbi:hypothetical protein APASM_0501 [Actinosynnema pretiosum subsp. pretiosum]|nr:hypothetical protein APASM_0501 [Actinosynnema pretiosum subsp. pretiosum]